MLIIFIKILKLKENSEINPLLKNKPEQDVATSEFSFSDPIAASPSVKRIVKKSQKIIDAIETERILNKSPELYSNFLERSPTPTSMAFKANLQTEAEIPKTDVADPAEILQPETEATEGKFLEDSIKYYRVSHIIT